MKVVLNNIEYDVIEDYRDCLDKNELQEKLKDVDYFDNYDYILGDYSYDKLRLKGFCNDKNKNKNVRNDYANIKKYIEEYCSYGCKYFILEKKGNTNK